ncbi:B-cell receptor CD22-like [Trichomycterus rosablanca]|uniref:B-cell receptor CD22-like n=1 Tax=Trichomycterus rosablanca TaxID=2290929 RepID=UPI002F3599F9
MVLPVPLLFLITISGVVDSQYGRYGYVRYTRSSICTLTGSTVTLGCSYTYPPPYIQFSFWTTEPMPYGMLPSDLITDPQYRGRVRYLGDMMHDCSMMLRDVVEQDEMVYFFVIVLTSGEVHYEGGVNLSVTGLQVEVNMALGAAVTLTCTSTCTLTDYPRFTWYLDGQYSPTYTTDSNRLYLLSVSKRDFSSYSCGLQGNKYRSPAVPLNIQYSRFTVSVSVSPAGDVLEGGEVTLTCGCDGYPPALYYDWYKDNNFEHSGGTYTISNVSSADSGVYRCNCSNGYDERFDSVMLNVLCKASILFPRLVLPAVLPSLNDSSVSVPDPPRSVAVSIVPSAEAVEGSLVELTCRDDANPPAEDYRWYKKGALRGGRRTLTIKRIRLVDAGEYKCSAGNKHGSRFSAAIQLSVLYPPKSASASISPSGDVTEGSSVTFKCSSDANPPVEDYAWYKGGVFQREGRTYTVNRVGIKDSGEYRCEAKNQHGEKTSNTATLSVLPQRNNVSVSVHPPGDIVEGESVTLTCSGDADPPVTEYAWYKGAVRKGSGRTYGVHRISSNDSGEYKCRGSNQHGDQFSIAVHLNVLYPPKSVAVSVQPSDDITKGTSVVLTCSGDANPPPPAKSYTWYKDGALLGRGRTFRVDGFVPEDAGEYECKSANAYGSRRSDLVSLRLSYPPRNVSVSVSPSGEITEGGSVTLTCRGDANPPVREYAWFKGAAKIGTGRIYSINRTSSGDSGEYKCQAGNEQGYQFSVGVRLNVLFSPSSGNTVYVSVGIVCAVVAALLLVFSCTRWKRQQRNRHDYENDNPHTDSRTHTPLNNLSMPPMDTSSAPARTQPGPPDDTYTALDPRTISPDYATLVTVKNRH